MIPKNKLLRFAKYLAISLLFFLVIISVFNTVEPNKVGIARNHVTGETWIQNPGWHFTAPWTWIATVSSNPIRVGIPTSGRGFSAKLVQFVPENYESFLEREGWRWYWWDNRISFNFGNNEEYRGFRNVMLGYAYSKKEYPFIKILTEYHESDSEG